MDHGPERLTDQDGQTAGFTLPYATGNADLAHQAQLLKADWAKEGIHATF